MFQRDSNMLGAKASVNRDYVVELLAMLPAYGLAKMLGVI